MPTTSSADADRFLHFAGESQSLVNAILQSGIDIDAQHADGADGQAQSLREAANQVIAACHQLLSAPQVDALRPNDAARTP